jgi:GDP/UDP-N,N'-diacetylbacillosamine 2-epimerase (hydrolysing)
MNIGVLTSSRADYGIYLPLLNKLKEDSFFSLNLIVFGTHLSASHGYTLEQIRKDGFEPAYLIDTMPSGSSALDISECIGKTIAKFGHFWNKHLKEFDLLFCLGDRYEMFAAVTAALPFNLKFVHFHGGETTLGLFDEQFRHSITLMSKIHFTSTKKSAKRVSKIIGNKKGIHIVGALSIDNLRNLSLLSIEKIKEKFNIDMSIPSILVTFHPETVKYEKNEFYIKELISALSEIDYQIIISMPNADTMGNMLRNYLQNFINNNTNVIGVESLGTQGYFSCLKFAKFMLGNSSSGIIEAASLGKKVIDIGSRQKGRERGKNVISCSIQKKKLLNAINKLSLIPEPTTNIYGDGYASARVIKILKAIK